MAEVDEAAVLTRAEAAEEGFTWQLDFDAPGQHFLSQDRCMEYLARARDQFRKEAGDA
jgi:hypothetical protein